MASPAERLADVATRRIDIAETEIRELREQVTDLRLALARQEGASLVWTRIVPVASLLVSVGTLAWRVSA